MIDPVDTEREPQAETANPPRILPNVVVPIGTGSLSVNPGIIPGIPVGRSSEEIENREPDETDEQWHYRTQAEVARTGATGKVWHRETPPDAGDLAAQESDLRPTDIPDAT